jgi:hypothetical protein
MRKVTFVIDDVASMRELYKDDLTEELTKDKESFKVIYSLIGNKDPDRYELHDMNGNKLNVNDLNGYQRGCIINDCFKYFSGKGNYCFETAKPFGVISITESEV